MTSPLLARCTTALAKRELLSQQMESELGAVTEKTARAANLELAQALIQKVAQETQEQLRYHLQDLTQTALDAVFPGTYSFKVAFELRRGRTEVDMWLDKDGTRMDPMDSNGGGVVDVIALALRVACWAISHTDNVLILDEPFKFIRGGARARLGDMVSAMARRLNLQLILVADVGDTGIQADREFTVSMKNRKSVITRGLS